MKKNKSSTVFEFTPSSIRDKSFVVPIYQRLFAWGRDEIRQLLEDLTVSYHKNCEKDYYIGTVVLSLKGDNRYTLIDGQQRLTTLFLIGVVLRKYYTPWEKFLHSRNENRISFSSRQDVTDILELLGCGENIQKLKISENTKTIFEAVKTIEEYFNSYEDICKDLSMYIYKHARLIGLCLEYDKNELNKYFEVMNNRGIQLEKHEILKAQILSFITDRKTQAVYGKIWEACSQMNVYIENNFPNVKRAKAAPLCSGKYNIDEFHKCLSGDHDASAVKKLKDILDELHTGDAPGREQNDNLSSIDPGTERYKSVCTFPDFLLHVYKIYTGDYKGVKILNKELLENFVLPSREKGEEFALSFIKSLLKFRILFDNYIIKRAENETREFMWKIRHISETEKSDFIREERTGNRDLEQIQSMLNVSTEPDHWLTQYLKYLDENIFSKEKATAWLEALDNKLALVRLSLSERLLDTANEILINPDFIYDLDALEYNESWIRKDQTERYWFFKLDYCLWKEYTASNIKDRDIVNYRFRPNNSLEHVHAQSERFEEESWDDETLNSFGNFALISVNSNSAYNDQSFADKKVDFKSRSKKWGYESLKLYHIYHNNDTWFTENCLNHEKEMLAMLRRYHCSSEKFSEIPVIEENDKHSDHTSDSKTENEIDLLFKALYKDPEIRKLCIEMLCFSIKIANQNGNDKWAVSMWAGDIFLYVGSIVAVSLKSDGVHMIANRTLGERYKGYSENKEVFASLKVIEMIYLPTIKNYSEAWGKVKNIHRRGLEIAKAKYTSLNKSYRKFHRNDILEYIESVTGKVLPRPVYEE